MECWSRFHVGAGTGAVIEPIQKGDHLPAIQSSKFCHDLGGELVRVVSHDVVFNFIGASPLELAERALAPRLVYVLQVPLQLLDPFKLSVANPTLELLYVVKHACGEASSNRDLWR
jgi:hypothetical protein